MATQKTWTAHDIKMGAIRLELVGGVLFATQGYRFIDDLGDEVEQLPKRTVSINVDFSTLPVEMQQALADINAFMYLQALIDEGME